MRTTYTYNEGINFLRAVSILGIVLYHIFPFAMKGGFFGVCFFFLISGYLAAKKVRSTGIMRVFTFVNIISKKGYAYIRHSISWSWRSLPFYRLSSGITMRARGEAGKYLSGLQQLVADADAGILLYEDHGSTRHLPTCGIWGWKWNSWSYAPLLFLLYKK